MVLFDGSLGELLALVAEWYTRRSQKPLPFRDCEFESHREHYGTGGRVVYCNGLENRRAERYREFESLPVRDFIINGGIIMNDTPRLFVAAAPSAPTWYTSPPAVGAWVYGKGRSSITFNYALPWKPNWLHRWFMKHCFDLTWVDYPTPKASAAL